MKHKHVAMGLIALSLVALAFVSTVAAQTEYYPNLTTTVGKQGYLILFTIDTTSDFYYGPFNGLQVKLTSIVITIYDINGVPTTIPWYKTLTVLTHNTIYILIPAAFSPNPTSGVNIVGTLRNGDTFLAAGPGWTWTGHT